MINYYKEDKGNVFLSPYNIYEVSAMFYEGSAGNTRKEFEDVMGYNEYTSYFVKEFDEDLLNKEGIEFATANGLWLDNSIELKKDYVDKIVENFNAKVENVDFRGNADNERENINRWVEKNTNGKIKHLFPRQSITRDTSLVLAGTIYFKGKWNREYDKEDDIESVLFHTPYKDKFVDMVTDYDKYKYYENDLFKALEIDYEGGDVSMLFILPKGDEGKYKMDETMEYLTPESFSNVLKEMNTNKVILKFPKFRFEKGHDLKQVLKKLGIKEAFTLSADFSGMSYTPLLINSATHKAYVEVNEEGTEASAATGYDMITTSCYECKEEAKEFIADHPFLFFIVEKDNNVILFAGKVSDPDY